MEELTFKNVMHCDKCHDTAFVDIEEDGERKVRFCECREKRKALIRLKKSGLENIIDGFRFDNFQTDEAFQRGMLDICRRFIAQDKQRMLYLSGQTGAGKTHLGTAVCTHYMDLGKEVYYTSYQLLMNELKSLLNTEAYNEALKTYGGAEVLYIDDFMRTAPSEADRKQAFELINWRIMTNGITIITSEQPIDTVIRYDEALGGRIKHQSGEFAVCIESKEGRNYRLKNTIPPRP